MKAPESAPEGRLNTAEAATHLGRSASWLERERAAGRGPRYGMIGRRVFYRRADLEEYVAGSIRETADSRRGDV